MPATAKKKKKRTLRPENYHLEIDHATLQSMFEKANYIEDLEAAGIPFDEAVKLADEKFGD